MKFFTTIKEIISETKVKNILTVLRKALYNYKRANSSLWVTSLSFYTVVSLVPIFAILFSLGNWLGINDDFLRQIIEYSPLNQESIDLLIRFSKNLIEKTRTGILAGLGFLILGWTLISMFSIIEKSFNDIWKVKKSRIFIRKFTDYFAFVIFFPTLLIISSGTARVIEYLGYTNFLLNILPFATLMVFFTCLYMMIPNTKVNFIPALISSVFISSFFYGFQSLFIFLQEIVATYNKIYGSFSVIFIFLFWLRIMWFFLILGAHLSYFLQNKNQLIDNNISKLSFYAKEKLSYIIISELINRYKNNLVPISAEELANIYEIPIEATKYILEIFVHTNIIGEIINNETKTYVIIKNIDTLNFNYIYRILENYGTDIEIKNKKFDFNEILEKK